jgi:putative ABC transport system permease protein
VTQVATLSSIATQTAIKSITDRPIIFGAVANPYLIGAGTSATSHRANVTGAEIPLPVDSTLAVAVATFPKAGVWGTLFDPADPFAEFYLDMAKRKAERMGVRFVAIACTSAQDIPASVQALRAQGVGGILQIPSIMIGGGFPALVKQARELGMVVVATNTGYPGAPLSIGASFYDNGYAQGLVMIRVLRGESPAKIPFQRSANPKVVVDLGAANDFGVTIPRELVARASE